MCGPLEGGCGLNKCVHMMYGVLGLWAWRGRVRLLATSLCCILLLEGLDEHLLMWSYGDGAEQGREEAPRSVQPSTHAGNCLTHLHACIMATFVACMAACSSGYIGILLLVHRRCQLPCILHDCCALGCLLQLVVSANFCTSCSRRALTAGASLV